MTAPTATTSTDAMGRLLPGFGRIFQGLCGVVLLMAGAWVLSGFPLARVWLIALAILLAAAQWRDARAWLVAVPMIFALVDLGAWTGRFLVSEQDALLAVLVGVALCAGHYRGTARQLVRPAFAPFWLLGFALAVGIARGLPPVPDLNANAWNGYLTGWNAVRVAKGPLWALILWPMMARQLDEDRTATEMRLALGMAAALVGFGVFVLWERGLFWDLIRADNVWGLFGTWLNLSGSYRITGPFSQMHLGGEAVDGFLALTWPFAFLLLVKARRSWTAALGIAATALAAYAVMVTFTRTTYAAIAAALAVYVLAALLVVDGGARRRIAAVSLYGAIAAAVFVFGFRLGGVLTTVGYLAAVLMAIGAGMYLPRGTPARAAVAAIVVALLAGAGAIALHGMLTSKWSAAGPGTAIVTVAASIMTLGGGGLWLGVALRPWVRTRAAAVALVSLAVVLPAAALSLSGFQMDKRFSLAQRDLQGRLAHWHRVLDLVPNHMPAKLLGMGIGRFPATNLLAAEEPTGTWHFDRDGAGQFLRLVGTASLCYGQRLRGLEPGTYRVEIGLRNPSPRPANLAVKLQPRHLLESESWQPQTKQLNFIVAPGNPAWRRVTGELHLDAASAPPWYDPRISVLALANQGDARSAVDIAFVRLIDPAGRDRVANGDFVAGADRWFAYNDFQHLEWHAKNFYVALYFDLGLLGIAVFALAFIVALARAVREAHRGSLFAAAAVAAVVGFLLLGATSTLLDVPQLMTLSLLVLVATLWRPRSAGAVAARTRHPQS